MVRPSFYLKPTLIKNGKSLAESLLQAEKVNDNNTMKRASFLLFETNRYALISSKIL